MKVDILSRSMGDLAALADAKATEEDIANGFHVPLPFLSGDTNLANMQAANHLHKTLAVGPRLRRRGENINKQLIPRFDPSGRLFVASDDLIPGNRDFDLRSGTGDKVRRQYDQRGAGASRRPAGAVGRRAVAAGPLGADRRAPAGPVG